MLATASTFGAIGGTMIAGRMADILGRRNTLIVTSCYSMIGSGLSAFSTSFNSILIGRLISGFGIGHYSTIVPIYIAECAETKKRGTLSTVPQLMVRHSTNCPDLQICKISFCRCPRVLHFHTYSLCCVC